MHWHGTLLHRRNHTSGAITRPPRHAIVGNSPMSRPLFELIGYRLAEKWTYLIPAE